MGVGLLAMTRSSVSTSVFIAAMETQGTHISDLPVDVLLEVFRRLPAADLTQGVSEVCVDWRDLAVEPGAWQGRRVQVLPILPHCGSIKIPAPLLQNSPQLFPVTLVMEYYQA